MGAPTVLKLGGELLEDADSIRAAAESIVWIARDTPLVVVHGGGRAIDAELQVRGVVPRFADGLRITDQATLDTVVSVLAGRTNTALVAAVGAAGGRAIGLTGADGLIGLSRRASPLRVVAGGEVDLGLVGEPEPTDPSLLRDLVGIGCIPIVCSIGVDDRGTLLNVNADVMAGHLASALGARELLIAGTTRGVLDGSGNTIDEVSADEIDGMAAQGTAHSGMIAKLNACRRALAAGVGEVSIVDGKGATDWRRATGTRIVARAMAERK